jgi:hypothetical protein
MVNPPPKVKAPTFRKNSPISQRLGLRTFPRWSLLVLVTTGMVHPHWMAPYSPRIPSAAMRPQVREPYRATPAAPARSKVGTMPSGVKPMAKALAIVSRTCVPLRTATRPSRYTDMAKIPTTTGFSP